MIINSRADLEALRGGPEFAVAMAAIYGASQYWALVDGAWALQQNPAAYERFDFTAEQLAAEAEELELPAPVPPADPEPADPSPAPLSLQQVAAARLLVQDWEVTGVEQSQGIAGAFLLDTDLAMVFFKEEFPDTEYIVMPPTGVTKYPGYVEVSRPGLSSISFIIMRVQ